MDLWVWSLVLQMLVVPDLCLSVLVPCPSESAGTPLIMVLVPWLMRVPTLFPWVVLIPHLLGTLSQHHGVVLVLHPWVVPVHHFIRIPALHALVVLAPYLPTILVLHPWVDSASHLQRCVHLYALTVLTLHPLVVPAQHLLGAVALQPLMVPAQYLLGVLVLQPLVVLVTHLSTALSPPLGDSNPHPRLSWSHPIYGTFLVCSSLPRSQGCSPPAAGRCPYSHPPERPGASLHPSTSRGWQSGHRQRWVWRGSHAWW